MKLIFGLGNPGKEYEKTRHNIGAGFIDFIAKQENLSFQSQFDSKFADFRLGEEKVILIKPQTFMNLSGKAVVAFKQFYKVETKDIFIAFDDLDLTQGEYKIQFSKYPKVHNGVNDVIQKLGTDQVNFVRIGVDGRNPVEREFLSGADYVLQKTDFNFESIYKMIYEDLKKSFQ